MMKRNIVSLVLAGLIGLPATTLAATPEHESHHATSAASAAQVLSAGEVRKVDLDAKKITIRHGPLENIGMPPMTMVFQVSDPALLSQVKPGDKVRFHAENTGAALTVTRLERE